jgi:transcriptional regulator with XRE-family HTH domain
LANNFILAKFFLNFNRKILSIYNNLGGIVMYRRIKDLRQDKDMTQAQMGEILSCSQRVYSNYERGEVDIPSAILIKLADFHSVSIDYILERTDKKEVNQ